MLDLHDGGAFLAAFLQSSKVVSCGFAISLDWLATPNEQN